MTQPTTSPRRSIRTAFVLILLAVLAAPALTQQAAQASLARTPAVHCVRGTKAPQGAFVHDTTPVSAAVKRQVERDVSAETAALNVRARRIGDAPALPAEIHVPVQIHIIHGKHKRDRWVTRKDARRLFYILRGGFNGQQDPAMTPTGIIFELNAITISRNDRWFHASPGSPADKQMKRTLHRGKRRVLNVYLNDAEADGGALLGFSRFPWLAGRYPRLDAVTINVASLPGGKARGYNLGDTIIHETGHWFGLFHTFEGGCVGQGDYVNDTAPEGEPSFECELTRDTCPTPLPAGWVQGDPVPAPVPDPVQNFMDYSYDRCMNHFTPDQRIRAVKLFLRFRAGR